MLRYMELCLSDTANAEEASTICALDLWPLRRAEHVHDCTCVDCKCPAGHRSGSHCTLALLPAVYTEQMFVLQQRSVVQRLDTFREMVKKASVHVDSHFAASHSVRSTRNGDRRSPMQDALRNGLEGWHTGGDRSTASFGEPQCASDEAGRRSARQLIQLTQRTACREERQESRTARRSNLLRGEPQGAADEEGRRGARRCGLLKA